MVLYLTVSTVTVSIGNCKYKHSNSNSNSNCKYSSTVERGKYERGEEKKRHPRRLRVYSPSRKSKRHFWRLPCRGTVLFPLQKAKGYHATVRHLEQSRDPRTLHSTLLSLTIKPHTLSIGSIYPFVHKVHFRSCALLSVLFLRLPIPGGKRQAPPVRSLFFHLIRQ